MTPAVIASAELVDVLAAYDVGPLLSAPVAGSGTANAGLVLETPAGRFFLKRRNRKYAQRDFVSFDHRLMEHLHPYGIGTPLAVRTIGGARWLEREGEIYELFPYQAGEPHDRHSRAQLAAAGRSLAAYHRATRLFAPPPGKAWPRYHDPRLIREGVEMIAHALQTRLSRADFAYLQAQAGRLECEFPEERYHALPKVVVHGDYHPGNLKFQADQVSGIFDLDWATVQPRLLDLADGVFLFAGERDSAIDPADIVSLTQVWRPSADRIRVFLNAYRETETVSREEWDALGLAVRARWIYCRIAGRLKLPVERQLDYMIDGLLEPLRALDDLERTAW
jgi:homoserine kinase type II